MQTKNKFHYFIALFGIILSISSCKKEYESIEQIDEAKIQTYIQKNNLTVTKDPAGFYYQILDQGTGSPLLNKDSVFYTATVKSMNGTVYYTPSNYTFDATYLGYVNPAAYRLAMSNINRGGKIRLIVPSYLAFGKNGQGSVPSNEVIISEISTFPETTLWQVEDRIINQYLTDKSLTGFTRLPSRVYRSILEHGTGTSISANSTITVKYTGRLLNGTIFDQTTDTDLERSLTDLITGWRKSLVSIASGSKVRIIVPSDLAYGTNETGLVPANAILDFTIEIVKVED